MAGARLKRAGATVCVSSGCLVGFVCCACGVPVDHEVSDVLGDVTGPWRDRVREENRNAWDQALQGPKVAPRPRSRQPSSRVSN